MRRSSRVDRGGRVELGGTPGGCRPACGKPVFPTALTFGIRDDAAQSHPIGRGVRIDSRSGVAEAAWGVDSASGYERGTIRKDSSSWWKLTSSGPSQNHLFVIHPRPGGRDGLLARAIGYRREHDEGALPLLRASGFQKRPGGEHTSTAGAGGADPPLRLWDGASGGTRGGTSVASLYRRVLPIYASSAGVLPI
jgi:hypothetical protein